MKDAQPKVIYLKDYQAPQFVIEHTLLCFDLYEDHVLVSSELTMRRTDETSSALALDGQNLELVSIKVDGSALSSDAYDIDDDHLVINDLPAEFMLAVQTKIKPQDNTSLEGLYKSSKMFCTQCEAEGFRHITYYLDRPDAMSVFETRITANKNKYPVLLSNGNLIEEHDLENGRHLTIWQDPHKKPCYLFALVAGDLEFIEDSYVTTSGKEVTLRIFVESQNIDKCDYAMDSLKRAMKWDEDVYGREYDLGIFNIVAVDDFNMGAMENKSLNIFNTSCVLANPKTATDGAYQRIEAVVAHEYFHNWTGNRVTCRDWFQLSLKEGFTVFRDAEFSSDMGSRTVKRIEDVTFLRTVQFAEDAGPMAHAIRPASFIEISNFYTVTVYEKGAEIVRMIHNLLGRELFRKGSDLYFERHDGQAVTTEDFVLAMEDASGIDLSQFRNWYSQAGTPKLNVTGAFDKARQEYSLTFVQSCRTTAESKDKKPFHIPVQVALVLADGSDAKLSTNSGVEFNDKTSVIGIKEMEQTIVFNNVQSEPVPSLLRGLSAPVNLNFPYSRDQLLFLMNNDSDGFNRWDAGQSLACDIILGLAQDVLNNKTLTLDKRLVDSFALLLNNKALDPAMVAQMLTLPSLAYLIEQQSPAHVDALYEARSFVKHTLSLQLHEQFSKVYTESHVTGAYKPTSGAMAQRSLQNLCLQYLLESGEEQYLSYALKQYELSDNMTEQSAALSALVSSRFQAEAKTALQQFYMQWKHEPW